MDVSELALELLGVLMREHAGLLAERYGGDSGFVAEAPRHPLRGALDSSAAGSAGHGGQSIGDLHPSSQEGEDDEAINIQTPLAVMEAIARKRGYVLPGKRIDYERTSRALLDDFRSGRLGHITLEYPDRLPDKERHSLPDKERHRLPDKERHCERSEAIHKEEPET